MVRVLGFGVFRVSGFWGLRHFFSVLVYGVGPLSYEGLSSWTIVSPFQLH